MAETIMYLGPILTVLIVLVLIFVALKLGKSIIWLLVNSVIGMAILVILNFLPFINVTINICNILIVVLGGIAGIALVVLLSAMGIAF